MLGPPLVSFRSTTSLITFLNTTRLVISKKLGSDYRLTQRYSISSVACININIRTFLQLYVKQFVS